jgi:hypothetical protein
MALVAKVARDGGLLDDVAMQAMAVDRPIALVTGRERPFEQHVIQVAERVLGYSIRGIGLAQRAARVDHGGETEKNREEESFSAFHLFERTAFRLYLIRRDPDARTFSRGLS